MKPGPLPQPLLHFAMFMSAVLINNQMNIQILRYIPVNLLQEGEKLLMAVALLALRQWVTTKIAVPSAWKSCWLLRNASTTDFLMVRWQPSGGL